jgi:hypothetical protein
MSRDALDELLDECPRDALTPVHRRFAAKPQTLRWSLSSGKQVRMPLHENRSRRRYRHLSGA